MFDVELVLQRAQDPLELRERSFPASDPFAWPSEEIFASREQETA